MSERIRGGYDDALYKSTFILLYLLYDNLHFSHTFYVTPRRGAKFCNQYVCMSVCSNIVKLKCPNLTTFSVNIIRGPWLSPSLIRYVLLVLWMR